MVMQVSNRLSQLLLIVSGKTRLRPCAQESGSVQLSLAMDLIQNFSCVHTGSEPKQLPCTRERIQVDPIRDKYIVDVDIP